MNKKILISLSVIAAVAAIAIGGTVAYFSDTETSTGNTIAAGTIDLKISKGTGWTDEDIALVTLEDLKPSEVHYVTKYLKVEGNPAKVFLQISGSTCDTGIQTDAECEEERGNWTGTACENPTNENNRLDKYTTYDLCIDRNENGKCEEDETIIHPDDHMKLSDISGVWLPLGTFDPGTQVNIIQSFHLQKEVTNWAQGDICTFNEKFLAQQTTAPDPQSHKILLEDKGEDWKPILGDGEWGVAWYHASDLTLTVTAHGLKPNTDYQIKINSPEKASWYPVDESTRVKMASALASGKYTSPADTAPPDGYNLFERGYWGTGQSNLEPTYSEGDVGVWAFTKHGQTSNGVTTDANGYFSATKTASLPAGEYSYIKLLVAGDDSPWTVELMEKTQPMSFIIQ